MVEVGPMDDGRIIGILEAYVRVHMHTTSIPRNINMVTSMMMMIDACGITRKTRDLPTQ